VLIILFIFGVISLAKHKANRAHETSLKAFKERKLKAKEQEHHRHALHLGHHLSGHTQEHEHGKAKSGTAVGERTE